MARGRRVIKGRRCKQKDGLMPILKSVGVEMPSDFPGLTYEAVYWLVDSKRPTSPPEIWGQYRDAWKALSYHFLSCAGHDEAYTASVQHHGDAPQHPERYKQEHHLFGFFYTGLAALEALHYGLFAMGALIRPQEFPMITPGNRRAVDPKKTFATFSTIFPGEALTHQLRTLKDDPQWTTWNDTRNVLSHRMIPGRAFSDPGGALWRIENGIEIAIDGRTTASQREWLVQHLSQIFESAHTFAKDHF
jgi:hypothetical protein